MLEGASELPKGVMLMLRRVTCSMTLTDGKIKYSGHRYARFSEIMMRMRKNHRDSMWKSQPPLGHQASTKM